MTENNIISSIESIFGGMDKFISSKTVIGDPVRVDDSTVIIPLVEVTCGMATGSYNENAKAAGGGGMSAKMTPTAMLVVHNGTTKLVTVKNQDAVSKALDMIPDILNKLIGDKVPQSAEDKARKMAEESRGKTEEM